MGLVEGVKLGVKVGLEVGETLAVLAEVNVGVRVAAGV